MFGWVLVGFRRQLNNYNPLIFLLSHPLSMREFTTPSFPVFMYDGQGNYAVRTMGEVSNFFIAHSFFHIAACLRSIAGN